MKAKKSKASSRQTTADEQQHHHHHGGSALTYLKNRLFYGSSSNTNQPPPFPNSSNGESSSASKASSDASSSLPSSRLSAQSLPIIHRSSPSINITADDRSPSTDRPMSRSFEDQPMFDNNNNNSNSNVGGNGSSIRTKVLSAARPLSVMGLLARNGDGGGEHNSSATESSGAMIMRRRPPDLKSAGASAGDGAETTSTTKRTSLVVIKEGLLYKKADFRAFHKASKLDRSWRLYRVVLRGHKLYLYKLSSESPSLRSLFPSSSSMAVVGTSPYSPSSHDLASSRSNSSIASSAYQIKSVGDVIGDPSEVLGPGYNNEDSREGHDDEHFLFGAVFKEVTDRHQNDSQQQQQQQQVVCLLLFTDELIIGARSSRQKPTYWEVDSRVRLDALKIERRIQVDNTFALLFDDQLRIFTSPTPNLLASWLDALQNALDRVKEPEQSVFHQGATRHPSLVVEEDEQGHDLIKGGTVEALVHELLFRIQGVEDDEFVYAFLLTYTMFTTSACVLEAIKAYAVAKRDAKLSMRILDIFMIWCEQFAQDVVGDVVAGMMAILDKLDDDNDTASEIKHRIKETRDLVLVTVNKNGVTSEQANESAVPPISDEYTTEHIASTNRTHGTRRQRRWRSSSTINLSNVLITGLTPNLFLGIDPEQFAEQIYIFHLTQHRLHGNTLQSPLTYIPRPHISAQILNSVAFTTTSPHFLTKLLRHHILIDSQQHAKVGLTSSAEGTQVAAENSTLMRTQLLEHWIRVGAALLDLGDMTGWCAVATGICTLGVTRLKESWKSVPRPLVETVIQDWVSLLVDHGFFSPDIWENGWEQESVVDKFAEVMTAKTTKRTNNNNSQGLAFFGTIRQSVDRLRKHIKDNYCDGNPGVVNFEKYWSIYRAVQMSLTKWRALSPPSATITTPFHPEFQVVRPLQAFFEHSVTSFISVPHDLKYLHECSLECEPRIFGQSFDRHRKFDSLHGNNVAPPSSLTLTFPEILEGYRLFQTDLQPQQPPYQEGAGTPPRPHVRKKSSSRSVRSDQGEQTTRASANPNRPALTSDQQQGRSSPRVTSRKMFRRRTYSFPPGGPAMNEARMVMRSEDGQHLSSDGGGGAYQDSYLESINSRTWLGSLISQKQGTHAAKTLIEAMQHRDRNNNGEWLIVVEHGKLVFKASTLLQSDDSVIQKPVKKSRSSGFMALAEKGSSGIRSRSGTVSSISDTVRKDEEVPHDPTLATTASAAGAGAATGGRCVMVNVKAGLLEYLVDTLVHGVSEYSKDMREQWQLPSLLNGRLEEVPEHLSIDEEEYTSAFFVTYRSFCSCVQLLDLLRKKFTGAIAASSSQLAHQRKRNTLETVFSTKAEGSSSGSEYNWRSVASTQLRVVNLILYWVEEHFYDFVDEMEILNHFGRFLEQIQVALDEWSGPLRRIEVPTSDTCQALSVARAIHRQMHELRSQFVQKILSPSYDLKAINYDTPCSRTIDELYTQLTLGIHSYSVGVTQNSRRSLAFSLITEPVQMLGTESIIVDQQSAFTLLAQVDRCVRQLFAAVTLQDWIQTFDVFEAQSSDLYSWLPAHKASQTPPMSSTLSPVREGPSAQPTSYHLSSDDVMISDIFTAIEGARRSIVSPSAFSADDLLLAFPSSIQYLYCMHFIVRSWVIHEICARSIDLNTRIRRIRKFLQMVLISKAVTERMTLFPELKDVEDRPRRVPGFVEYAIASALISPEVRLFTRAWSQVARSYGLAHIDTLENLLVHAQRKTAATATVNTAMTVLVPSVGWVFERMLELCAVVPDDYNHQPYMINFDKRRYVFHFLQLVMNAQMDLEEQQPVQDCDTYLGFVISPNPTKPMWRELKDCASRENKGTTSGLSGGSRSHYVREQTVFGRLVNEQLEKLKRDIKERDRIDKEWRDLQHKMQKRQLEQARYLEKQERKNQQQQQHHHLPKLNALFRGRQQQRTLSSQQEQDQLCAFETAKASTVINLIHATTSVASTYTKRDHVFRIVTEEGGQFLFQGMSRDDMHDWMQQINNAAREGAVKRRSVLAAESSDGTTIHLAELGASEDPYLPNARKSVYGMDLEALMHNGSVPLIAEKCITEIEKRGLEEVGIYRMAGTGSVVEQLKAAFNRDMGRVDLGDPMWADINVIADAFKQFLRSIPGSLLTHTYYDEFIHASASEDHDQRVYLIKQVLKKLPFPNYMLLKRLIGHFVIVTDFEAINHMYATNLAIVFGPTLLQPAPGPASFGTTMSNLGYHQTIVKYLILHYHYLFDVESDQQEDENNSTSPDAGNNEATNPSATTTITQEPVDDSVRMKAAEDAEEGI